MKTNYLGLIVLTLSASIHANPLDLYYQRYLQQSAPLYNVQQPSALQEKSYQQQIDHTKPELGTFAQRYFVDETYVVNNNSPIFLYVCGEANCDFFQRRTSVTELAQKHHARIIFLEHRYYGKSTPVKTFSAENLQYLTYQNVMPDIATFQQEVSQQNHWTGKWIVFGGSYGGIISAFYREIHPELVAGSIASSAPVLTTLTFEGFDEHVTKVVGPDCADKMRLVTRDIESAMNDEKHMTEIKKLFHATDIIDNRDFLGMVADVGGFSVQYGYSDYLCGSMDSAKTPTQGFAAFANLLFSTVGIKPSDITPQAAMSENPKDYENFIGMRQWYYQTCKEFGAWNVTSSDPQKTTRSQLLNAEYSQEICKRLFGIETQPDVQFFYDHYYLKLLNEATSHILFTNGSNDPWSKLSLIDENNNTSNKNLSYFMIQGGSHCDDLNGSTENDSPSLQEARIKADNLISEWLS